MGEGDRDVNRHRVHTISLESGMENVTHTGTAQHI